MSLEPTLGDDFEREHPAPTSLDKFDAAPQNLTATAKEKLRQMVARIETLEEEKAGIAGDIKEAFGEAKTLGYDTKALRKVIALRKMDREEREALDDMITLYCHALGDI